MYPLHFFLFCYFVLTICVLLDQDWPYTGTRYMTGFAPRSQPQQRQPQSSPHMVPHGPPPIPPPPAEYQEDPAAQAARGYMYAYQPYAYPGQMIPGMPPPPPGYMPGPYMQPMPYPMPPPGGTSKINYFMKFKLIFFGFFSKIAMYPGAPMGQMPRKYTVSLDLRLRF